MTEETNEQDAWLDSLDDELKLTIKEVKQELIGIKPELKDIKLFDAIDEEVITKFITANSLNVTNEFKKQLTNLFSLAKYINLTIQQNSLLSRLSNELDALLDKEKVSWVLHDDFTNTVTFTNILPVNAEGIKPQSLVIKYRIDQDTDKVIYSIVTGHWGWDISKQNLKALLEGTNITSNTAKVPSKGLSYNINGDNIVISDGSVEIRVNKL